MHVSIRRYEQVRSVAEVCRKITESFVPLLRRSPGFIAYYAIDGGGGTMATISIFSTEAMALEFERAGLRLDEGECRGPAAGAGGDHFRRGQGDHHRLMPSAPGEPGANRTPLRARLARRTLLARPASAKPAGRGAPHHRRMRQRLQARLPGRATRRVTRRSPRRAASLYQRIASAGLASDECAATLRGSKVCASRRAASALPFSNASW